MICGILDFSILEYMNEIKTKDDLLVLDGQLLADLLGKMTHEIVEVVAEDLSVGCFKKSPEFLRVCNIKVRMNTSGFYCDYNIYASHSGIMDYLINRLHITPDYIQIPPQPQQTGTLSYCAKSDRFPKWINPPLNPRVYPDVNNERSDSRTSC